MNGLHSISPLGCLRAHLQACTLCLALLGAPGWSRAAGTVDAVRGEAVILGIDGSPRVARPGERVTEGESLVTGDGGQVSVVTDDSGALLLRPRSRLLLDGYQAGGTERDTVVLRLLRGGVRVSAGWVAERTDRWRLETPSATVRTRSGDQEVRLLEDGASPRTWLRQWAGEASLSTGAGSLRVGAGEAASVSLGDQPPQPETAVPEGVLGAADPAYEALAQGARAAQAGRLLAVQQQMQRSGGASPDGNPRVSAQCTPDAPAQRALDALLRAYEQGDIAFLQLRIDPSLPGYGLLINDAMTQHNRQRQTRIHVLDRQMQCGPDVSVIDFAWEKRYLDAVTFRPVLQQGRASVLISALGGGLTGPWRINGFMGDNPLRVDPAVHADMVLATPTVSYASLPGQCRAGGPVSVRVRVTAQVPGFTFTAFPSGNPPAAYTYRCNAVSDGGGRVLSNSPPVTAPATVSVTPLPPAITAVPLSAQGQAVVTVQGPAGSVQPFSTPVALRGQAGFNVTMWPEVFHHSVDMQIAGSCSGTVRLPESGPLCQPTPAMVPFSLTVRDSSKLNHGVVQVEVRGSTGDAEVLNLPAVSPGVFALNALPVTQGATDVVPGSGRLELSGPASFTLRYAPTGGVPLVRALSVVP